MITTPIRFVLIGCGRVSTRHLEALGVTTGAEIVAVVDPRADSQAETFSKKLNIPWYRSTKELYQSSLAFDVVDIATPSGDHFVRASEALREGKHVVLEKPVTLRIEHALGLDALSQALGLKLWVAHQNRYNRAVMRAREELEKGRFGKLVSGTVRLRWCRRQDYYDADDWHGRWATDGGVTTQQAIHHIDMLQWFLGPVESVESQLATSLVKMECEDTNVSSIRFSSGALGVVEVMTSARPRDIEASLSIMGERGSIVLGGVALNKIDFWEFENPVPEDIEVRERFSEEVPNAYGFGHNTLFSRVVSSIRDNTPPEISALNACEALSIVHGIYSSWEAHSRLLIPEQLDERPQSKKLGVITSMQPQGQTCEESYYQLQSLIENDIGDTGNPEFFCAIIGDRPSQGARSPFLWRAAFEALGINAAYVPLDTSAKNLELVVKVLRENPYFKGGNITLPYKVAIIPFLDGIDEAAKAIGAVNTIKRTAEGKLIGTNTDAVGGVRALAGFFAGRSAPRILQLGAGGAGRAVAFGLTKEMPGARYFIWNRSQDAARKIADNLRVQGRTCHVVTEKTLEEVLGSIDLVINCTSLGQEGMRRGKHGGLTSFEGYSPLNTCVPLELPEIPNENIAGFMQRWANGAAAEIAQSFSETIALLSKVPAETKFFDVIFSPAETQFLACARLSGHRTLNGKMMSVEQAVEGFIHVCGSEKKFRARVLEAMNRV